MIRILCDECGKDITTERKAFVEINVESEKMDGSTVPLKDMGNRHYCLGCAEKISRVATMFADSMENPKKEPREEPKPAEATLFADSMVEQKEAGKEPAKEKLVGEPKTQSLDQKEAAKEPPTKDDGAVSEPENDTPPRKPKKKNHYVKQPKFDFSKAVALQKAGWSIRQIADEFGMTPGSVSTEMYKCRKLLKSIAEKDAERMAEKEAAEKAADEAADEAAERAAEKAAERMADEAARKAARQEAE